jgi:hypothetical protein
VLVHPPQRAVGVLPLESERLGGLDPLPPPLELRITRRLHRVVHVEVGSVQEVPHVERRHEVGHDTQLEIPRLLEPLDDDLLDRSSSVQVLHDLGLARLEPVVQEVAVVREHRVVLSLAGKLLDLDVIRQLRPELTDVDPGRDDITQPPALADGLRSRLHLDRAPDAGARSSERHVLAFSSSIRRCTVA